MAGPVPELSACAPHRRCPQHLLALSPLGDRSPLRALPSPAGRRLRRPRADRPRAYVWAQTAGATMTRRRRGRRRLPPRAGCRRRGAERPRHAGGRRAVVPEPAGAGRCGGRRL